MSYKILARSKTPELSADDESQCEPKAVRNHSQGQRVVAGLDQLSATKRPVLCLELITQDKNVR